MLCVAITTTSTWLGPFTIARPTRYMITDLGYGTYFVFGAFIVSMRKALWVVESFRHAHFNSRELEGV